MLRNSAIDALWPKLEFSRNSNWSESKKREKNVAHNGGVWVRRLAQPFHQLLWFSIGNAVLSIRRYSTHTHTKTHSIVPLYAFLFVDFTIMRVFWHLYVARANTKNDVECGCRCLCCRQLIIPYVSARNEFFISPFFFWDLIWWRNRITTFCWFCLPLLPNYE